MPPRRTAINHRGGATGTFLDELAVGRYIEGNSPLHRAPRAGKAVLFTLAATATFFYQSAASFLLLGVVLTLLARTAGIPQQTFWRSLRPLLLLGLFSIIAGAFLNHPQASLFSPSFSWDGLHVGGLFAARLATITLLTTLFFLTTRPDQVVGLGIQLMRPLQWIGIDSKELSLLTHLAYRFVPLLTREIHEQRLGRLARNLSPAKGVVAKLFQSMERLTDLFVGAVHRAETTALAMDQRGVLAHWNETSTTETSLRHLFPVVLLSVVSLAILGLDGQSL